MILKFSSYQKRNPILPVGNVIAPSPLLYWNVYYLVNGSGKRVLDSNQEMWAFSTVLRDLGQIFTGGVIFPSHIIKGSD